MIEFLNYVHMVKDINTIVTTQSQLFDLNNNNNKTCISKELSHSLKSYPIL